MMMRHPDATRAEISPQAATALPEAGTQERHAPVGFRVVDASGRLVPPASDSPMSRQFTATILLNFDWELDVEAIAATTRMRFPTIGDIDAFPADGSEAGAVTIDGARVTLTRLPGRVPTDRLNPPLKPVRSWDCDSAVRRHVAAIEVTCGGELSGLEGAEAYAAAVHFVVAAACQVAPACAVLWREGCAITEPGVFADCAEDILHGRMPLAAWVSFAAVVPKGHAPEAATGMVTYGLRRFIGRELELAPRPGSTRDAYRCVSRIARMALDRGLKLEDGQHIADPEGAFAVTVRERTFWLRRNLSAYVLVAGDSVLDVETLRPRNAVA